MVRSALAGGVGGGRGAALAACGSSGPGRPRRRGRPIRSTRRPRPRRRRDPTSTIDARPRRTAIDVGIDRIDHDVGADGDGDASRRGLPDDLGVTTTTTALPGSVSVSVPTSDAQQGNLAVYSDETGRLMLVGPTVGWTCNGSFGADGSGLWPWRRSGRPCRCPGTHVASADVLDDAGDRRHGERCQPGAGCRPCLSVVQRRPGGGAAEPRQELCRQQPLAGTHVQGSRRSPSASRTRPAWRGSDIPSGGQNPANGVALYQPKPTEATAYLATCTLPAAQQRSVHGGARTTSRPRSAEAAGGRPALGSLGGVADRLDVVPVRVAHERAVVVGVVLGPQPRLVQHLGAERRRAASKKACTAARSGALNAMCVSRKPSPVCCCPIQNVAIGRDAVADGGAELHDPLAAERGEDGVVEGGALARSRRTGWRCDRACAESARE